MTGGRAALGAALFLLAGTVTGCGSSDPPPQPETVGSAVLGVTTTDGDREIVSSDVQRLDAAAVERYFDVRIPPGASGPLAVLEGFMDDRAVARFTIPAAAVRRFARDAGLADDERCSDFEAVTVGGLRVGPVPAGRVRCFEAQTPDAGRLALRRVGLVDAGDEVEVLLFGFTT